MKRALTFAAGFAVGYVAGARAGREKYEQIADAVHALGRRSGIAEVQENLQEQVGAATRDVTVPRHQEPVGQGPEPEPAPEPNAAPKPDTALEPEPTPKPGTALEPEPELGEYPAAPTGIIPGSGTG